MAVLQKIVARNFRNIAFAELFFSGKINCISGNNGSGKTNLLDAIHYLCMTKSAFPCPDRSNIRYGCDGFAISGDCLMPSGTVSKFALGVDASLSKKLLRDGKPLRKMSEHVGTLPVVMVSPRDGALVSESGEERRRFANSVLSQIDREYLSAVQQYNRILSLRNRILKDRADDPALLDVYDASLDGAAVKIHSSRRHLAESLADVVNRYYEIISGGRESVSVKYSSDLDKAPLGELLSRSRGRDLMMGFTTVGVQRDDFIFSMDGEPIRYGGSQGQQKSFLVALKFAQYEIMAGDGASAPMMLLDDVFDKLDMGRTSNLISMVAGNGFGQIFLTDSNKVRLKGVVDGITQDRAYFEAGGGAFERVE